MNKELREDLEHLIICNDKSITQDLRDDIKMTLDYIKQLEEKNKIDYLVHMKKWAIAIGNNAKLRQRIDKAIEYIEDNDLYTQDIDYDYDENMVLLPPTDELERQELLDILRGEDNEN